MQDSEDGQTARIKRKRLDPRRREQEIVEGAILYFSEVGFSGSMRDLAARIGISHALLFRYFPTKEALVDRVRSEEHTSELQSQSNLVCRLLLEKKKKKKKKKKIITCE